MAWRGGGGSEPGKLPRLFRELFYALDIFWANAMFWKQAQEVRQHWFIVW